MRDDVAFAGQEEAVRLSGGGGRLEPGSAAQTLAGYGQVDDTIFTLSTFRVGAFAADAGGFCSLLEGCSTVPMISTLWPT
jgi:hypothetical protein